MNLPLLSLPELELLLLDVFLHDDEPNAVPPKKRTNFPNNSETEPFAPHEVLRGSGHG